VSRKASGLKAWALQRGTAIYLALFFVYLVGTLLLAAPTDEAAWRAWWSHPVMSVAALVFVAALLVHAWIGVRDILIDYLWHTGARVAALALVALVLVGSGLWAAQVLILARLA
jgi:succinate dehydrogenase / fumarate reductase membrane anchor subunit